MATLAFAAQATLAGNEAFVVRVRQAMITQAIAIMGKAADPAEGDKAEERQKRRTRYAVEALRNPDTLALGMVRAVVTVDAASESMTDPEIKQAVRGLWDAFSEVIL